MAKLGSLDELRVSSSEKPSSNRFRAALRMSEDRGGSNIGSVAASLNSQHEVIDVQHPQIGRIGICRGEPLTDAGKRLQLLKILSLTVLPILGLWAFTVYSLSDSIQGKMQIEETQYVVKFSVQLGKFLNRMQSERDMSVLYLSILGPETKTFLLNEYLLTDQMLESLTDWPAKADENDDFRTKDGFQEFLTAHRNSLDSSNFNIYTEIDYYNKLIERLSLWLYTSIRESNLASIWKTLVAYQKIVTGMENIGIERSLGSIYYADGGFDSPDVYEYYTRKINRYNANYRAAIFYSPIVFPVFRRGMARSGRNLSEVIESFREEILYEKPLNQSLIKAQWWFDNMTLYLETFQDIQGELAVLINDILQDIISAEEKNLIISAAFLVIVILMCPIVIYSVEALTSDIQKYAITLVHKTKELSKEKKKTDSLLYQMVPPPVAEKLKRRKEVDAEYFKSVTIMFSDIFGFTRISTECNPLEIVSLLNNLYRAIDEKLDNHDVYKVETINDSYMVASGIPVRIGHRHSAEIASLALDLMAMMNERKFSTPGERVIQLRIGINTGHCMAGIVGTMMPRYCLFGDTVNTASRMKTYGLPSKIHVSSSTYNSLQKHDGFILRHRGNIQVKGKGTMKTYWLVGRSTDTSGDTQDDFDAGSAAMGVHGENNELPGEIQQIHTHDQAGKLTMFSMNQQVDSLEKYMGYVPESDHDQAV